MPPEDDGFLPDTRTVTPEQQGAAVTRSLTEDQAKANLKRRLDELDINDPGEAQAEPRAKAETPSAAVVSTQESKASAPTFAPELLARAREHGITAHEAKEFGSPALLERALAHMDRSLASRRPEPAPRQEPTAQEEESLFPDLPDETGTEGTEWDPNLRSWVKQTRDAFERERSENKALKEQLSQVAQHLQRQEVERITAQWDGFFEKAPDEYREALGEGALADLQGTAAADLRLEVFRTFLALQQSYQSAGQKPPSFKTLAERSLRACATPSAKTEAKPDAGSRDIKYRDAQGRIMAAPTSRSDSVNSNNLNGDKPPADDKAREEWAMRRFKKRATSVFGDD